MPRNTSDSAVSRIAELYAGLSPFDRGRVTYALQMLDGGKAPEAESRKIGRPVGSKNKPKAAASSSADAWPFAEVSQ